MDEICPCALCLRTIPHRRIQSACELAWSVLRYFPQLSATIDRRSDLRIAYLPRRNRCWSSARPPTERALVQRRKLMVCDGEWASTTLRATSAKSLYHFCLPIHLKDQTLVKSARHSVKLTDISWRVRQFRSVPVANILA